MADHFSDAKFKEWLPLGQKKIDEAPVPPQYFHDPYYPLLKPENPNHVEDGMGADSDDKPVSDESPESNRLGRVHKDARHGKHAGKHQQRGDAGHHGYGKHGTGSRNDHGRHDHGQGNGHSGPSMGGR